MRARKILIPLVVLLFIVLVLPPLALRFFFPEPKLRAMVLPRAEAALGRPVDCGRIGLKLGLSGVAVELETLELGADSTGYGLKSLDLPLLRARLALLPLLRREVDIKTLTFVEPGVELLLPPPGSAPAGDAAGEAAGTAAVAVAAPDLRLENARVHLRQEEGYDLELRIGSGRFASALSADGDLALKGRIEDATLNGKLADGRALSALAELDLDLDLTDGLLALEAIHLILRETRLDSAAGGPALAAARIEIVAAGTGPLEAFEASPPDLSGLTLSGELKVADLVVAGGQGATYALTLPLLEAPLLLDASTAGELRLTDARLEGGRLETATSLGNRFTASLPSGTLDLALKPEATGLALPRLDLAFTDYELRSEPTTGKNLTMRGTGATLAAQALLPPAPGKPSMRLDLRAEPLRIEGDALPRMLQVEGIALQGGLDSLHFDGLRLIAGESRLQATGGLALPQEPGTLPRMDIRVTGTRLDLADFLPPAPDGKAATAAGSGAAPPETALAPLPGRAEFQIDELVTEQATVTSLSGLLLAELDGLRVENLNGALMGGGLTGALALTPRAGGKLDCRGDFSVSSVQAPSFLAAFTPVKRGVEGNLSTQTEFDFVLVPGQPPTGLALDAAFDLGDGALVDLPALQQLSSLAGLEARDRYALGDLAHRFQVRENRVLARDLRLPFEDGFLVASGSAGLDGTLDFRGKWELGSRTVARIGAGDVLGFLADAEGKVELDFIVRGTTKSPSVTLDTQALRDRLAEEARKRLQDEGEDLLKKGLDALRGKLK